jgi:hypothetical protein
MSIYRLYTYGVWGNAEDGYDVNDVYRQGPEHDVTIPDGASDAETIRILETDGALKPGSCVLSPASWEGDVLYLESVEDGRPVCEYRKIIPRD